MAYLHYTQTIVNVVAHLTLILSETYASQTVTTPARLCLSRPRRQTKLSNETLCISPTSTNYTR